MTRAISSVQQIVCLKLKDNVTQYNDLNCQQLLVSHSASAQASNGFSEVGKLSPLLM